ncbi:Kinesin-like protein kif15 [Balamuthia mandrillaris]
MRSHPPHERERSTPRRQADRPCPREQHPSQHVFFFFFSFDQTNSKIFSFDYVAGEDSTQEEIFLNAGKEIAECCMAGYHASIFAYGQTGSGKTFTIQGGTGPSGEVIDSMKGLTPRVIEYLFSLMAQAKHKSGGRIEFLCRCSYLEIYNEKIKDLLAPGSENLNIREDFRKGIYVENLTEKIVSSPEEACQVLAEGSLNRHVASTSCNQKSSRSHSVFSLMLESKEQERGGELSRVRFSRLNLIDLAGSERQKDAETSGSVLREAGCINKSLSLLGNVIRALVSVANGKVRHIPYRDSKLTFLLKDSLGGNSKTTIIATISPVDRCLGESISTLQFAGRAKLIRNKAVINEDTCGSVPKLREEVKRLKEALLKLSSANKLLVTSNSNMNNSQPTLPSTEERNVTIGDNHNKTLNVNEINKALVEARQLQTLFLTRETLEKRVEELEQLCKKKDAYIQKCHMKEKLKEDTIARLSQDANRRYCCSRCPDPSHQPCFPKDEQEQGEGEGRDDVWNNTPPPVHVEELQFELALLKKQMQHHPGMARLAAENQRLTTELRQWEQRFGNKCQSYEAELVELRRITTNLSQQLALLQSYSTSCVIPQHPSESGNNIAENIPQSEDALSEERPTDASASSASSSETMIETDAEAEDAKTKEMNNLEETYQRVYAKYEMELNAMWSFAQDLEATLEQEKQRSKSAEEQYLDEIRRWREGYELAECCTVEANRRVKMLQEKLERLSEERQRWSEAAGLKQERLKKVNRRLIEQNKQKSEEKEKKKNNIHGGRRFSLLPFYQDSTSTTFEKEEEESRRHSLSSLDENNINDESNGSSWFSLAQLQQWKEFLRFARSHKDVPSASIPSTTLNEFSTATFDASSSSSVNATNETMDKEETITDSLTQQNEAEEKQQQETEQETNTNEEMAEKEEEERTCS